MKRLQILGVLIALGMTLNAQTDERVLLTVNGTPTTVDEFLYIYNKNQQDSIRQSIDEYLDLFINFKLKVEAAKEAGIDTTVAFQRELTNYRKQATAKYMTDSESEEQLVRTIYDRMQTDVLVSHIAIQCPMSADDSTVEAALAKIKLARERVTVGVPHYEGKGYRQRLVQIPEDFKTVAMEMSEDPSIQKNQGQIGWVTPFRFVLSFENAAYETKVGEVSEVFRSPFGFHILKVEQTLPHKEVNAAHIMKMTPRDNDSIVAVAKEKIDSLYKVAIKGDVPFNVLALANSDDRGSSQRGGDLGWFGRGMMVPEFENTCFSMNTIGEISKPFKSDYGWHIVQYNGEKGADSYEEAKPMIEQRIPRTEYQQEKQKAFVEKLKKEYQFAETAENLKPFVEATAGCKGINDSLYLARIAGLDAPLFTLADKQYTQADFAAYLKSHPATQTGSLKQAVQDKYEGFVSSALMDYEDSQLEKKYSEFKNLVTEYHDGILLFDISLENVWDKAIQDTEGITAYFNQHKKEYKWDAPRYKGYVIYAKDEKSLKAAKSIIKNANPDSIGSYIKQRINGDSTLIVRYEAGIWQKGQNAVVDKMVFKQKDIELPNNELFPYYDVVGKKMKAPEKYSDERTKVTQDYQAYLEEQWIDELRKKYEVVVDKEVLRSIE